MITGIDGITSVLQSIPGASKEAAAASADGDFNKALSAATAQDKSLEQINKEIRSSLTSGFLTAAMPSAMSGSSAISSSSFVGAIGEGGGMEMLIYMLCTAISGKDDAKSQEILNQLLPMLGILPPSVYEQTRQNAMDLDFDTEVLDEVNALAFEGAGDKNYPYEAWKACDPLVTNAEGNRSALSYRAVIDQFDVENNPRYAVNKNGDNDTYCNIFVSDVTTAMGAGIQRRSANSMHDYLVEEGAADGWIEVSAQQAQTFAAQGHPAVSAWKNSSGHGHVQVVCPPREGGYDEARGVSIAQAGSKLLSYGYAGDIFSSRALGNVRYFVHL